VSGARERICEAMLDLVYTQGYEATSIEEVLERAGSSREEFDRDFASKEDCALAVFDIFMSDFEREISAAYEGKERWPDSLRAAAYATARWMIENPRGMRFGTVEMLWVSELSQARREAGFQTFLGMVDAGRARAEDPESVPPFTAEKVIGSIAEILTKGLQRPQFDPYERVPELMYLAVLPYMGEEAAVAELAMPAPVRPVDGE
jgi:AcrR family transcriptional regulator